jgi:galactokinase
VSTRDAQRPGEAGPPSEDLLQALGRVSDALASAPGRVNLLGEHTDYNEGFVLPTVIPQRTRVAVAKREDGRVIARSLTLGESREYRLGQETRRGAFSDYVAGVTFALARAGHGISGFDVVIASDVPVGSGLSSSAALSVALLRALREAFALELDDLAIARLAKEAENEIVGAPVGMLDPIACSLGAPGAALFVDMRTLAIERIPLPRAIELVVVDSGVAHDHASGEYRRRRAECEEAATWLRVSALRDVDETALDRIAALPAPLDRRARHVITENARVLRAVSALRAGDVDALGPLFAASHRSMRDDYEVSVAAVDRLVERAAAHRHVVAARLTGGGFGGAVVVLARAGHGAEVARALSQLPGARALVPEIGA